MTRTSALFFFLFCVLIIPIGAQEFNFTVSVNAPRRVSVEEERFVELENQVREYLNNTRFTRIPNIEEHEKIKGDVVINITEEVDGDGSIFRASMIIKSRRPIYGSKYESQIFNHQDDDITFEFIPGTQLTFSEQFSFQNELSRILTYYVYVVMAYDFDTFGRLGGDDYWDRCNAILSNLGSNPASGWETDERFGRASITLEMLQANLETIRDAWHQYHREGLDIMHEKPEEGRINVLAALRKLHKIGRGNPNLVSIQKFFDSKSRELVDILVEATEEQKKSAYDMCMDLNPIRKNTYNKLLAP